jgi:hypothetical protein
MKSLAKVSVQGEGTGRPTFARLFISQVTKVTKNTSDTFASFATFDTLFPYDKIERVFLF